VRASPTSSRSDAAAFLLALWRVSRPAIWLVSVLPFSVGYVLASHRLFPRWDWSSIRSPLLATLAIGPMFWLAALVVNDIHDLPADRINDRKQRAPIVLGTLSLQTARAVGITAIALDVALGLLTNATVTALTVVLLLCAWLYSAPPVRLKERPGADLAVNAGALGGLTLLAGWASVRSLNGFPWPMLAQGVLVAAALYIPTTLVDFDADAAAGLRTIATRLGPRRTALIGLGSWIAANVGAVVLAALDIVIPRTLLPFLAIAAVGLVAEYAVLIVRPRVGLRLVRGIVITSVTFFAANLVFAIQYTRR
jgi:4-hydroxybenzoate polyprenyltransferase